MSAGHENRSWRHSNGAVTHLGQGGGSSQDAEQGEKEGAGHGCSDLDRGSDASGRPGEGAETCDLASAKVQLSYHC